MAERSPTNTAVADTPPMDFQTLEPDTARHVGSKTLFWTLVWILQDTNLEQDSEHVWCKILEPDTARHVGSKPDVGL